MFFLRLSSAASDVSRSLEDSKTTQDRILDSQQESLKVQEDLLKENNALFNVVTGVKHVFDEFQYVFYINLHYFTLFLINRIVIL